MFEKVWRAYYIIVRKRDRNWKRIDIDEICVLWGVRVLHVCALVTTSTESVD